MQRGFHGPWRFLDYFALLKAGIFGIFAQNLPLWSLRPSLTVGMTKIPKAEGSGMIISLFILLEYPESSHRIQLRKVCIDHWPLALATPLVSLKMKSEQMKYEGPLCCCLGLGPISIHAAAGMQLGVY